jgi:hypothetical protein
MENVRVPDLTKPTRVMANARMSLLIPKIAVAAAFAARPAAIAAMARVAVSNKVLNQVLLTKTSLRPDDLQVPTKWFSWGRKAGQEVSLGTSARTGESLEDGGQQAAIQPRTCAWSCGMAKP